MPKETLRVWMISDSKPGHYNQTLGVIEALKQQYDIELFTLQTKLQLGLFRQPLKYLSNNQTKFSNWLLKQLVALVYKKFDTPSYRPDIIVSCGGHTIYLNCYLANRYRSKNFFLGSLRGVKADLFTGIISGLNIPNIPNLIELELSPGVFTFEKAKHAGIQFIQKHQLEKRTLWAMLIGGDGAGYSLNNEYIDDLLELMHLIAHKKKVQWLLTTSRRTSTKHEKMIGEFISSHPESFAYAVLYNKVPEKVVMPFLGAADVICCSEDSSSMISEAIISRKPVITLHPAKCAPTDNYRQFLQKHTNKKRLLSHNPKQLAADLSLLNLDAFEPLNLSIHEEIFTKLKDHID